MKTGSQQPRKAGDDVPTKSQSIIRADTFMTREHALALTGAVLLLPSGAVRATNAVRVGSKVSSENATIAEVYARA